MAPKEVVIVNPSAIIFSNSNLALQFLDDSKAKSIGTYLRNYEDDLEYYGDQSDSEKNYMNLKIVSIFLVG